MARLLFQMITRTGPQLGNWEGQCTRALERLGKALADSTASFVDASGVQERLLRAITEQLQEAASRVS